MKKLIKRTIRFILILLPALMVHSQSSLDWKSQTTGFVVEGYSSNDPNDYIWSELSNIYQGVHINVLPSERVPIYIEQGNNIICFNTFTSPAGAFEFMVKIDVSVNNNGYVNIYEGNSSYAIIWSNSSSYFPLLGVYNLKVEIIDPFYNIYHREYDIKVIPSSNKLFKDNFGNTMRLWQGNNPGENIPVIFSEGFDAYETNPQQMYYWAASELITCLLNNGFDIYFLDNKYGTQDIRNNAAGFTAAVRYVSEINNNQPTIAGGVSMGGMIARYAFAKAEEQQNPLPAYIFISVDSPQQGAVISDVLQDYKKEKNSGDAFAAHSLNNDAAKQLLKYSTYDPSGLIHTNFFNELNNLNMDGYPHLTHNIGISFSNQTPNPNSGVWLTVDWEVLFFNGEEKSFELTSSEKDAGSYLPIDLTTTSPFVMANYAWYSLLGMTLFNYPTITITRSSDPAYIPYESALDIVNGESKFDVTIEPQITTYHDVLPSEIVNDIVNALTFTDIYIQNKIFSTNKDIIGKSISAGNKVNTYFPIGDVLIFNNAHVNFIAKSEITLKDGFYVQNGAYFNALIDENLDIVCNQDNKNIKFESFIKDHYESNILFEERLLLESQTKIGGKNISLKPILNIFPNPHPGIFTIAWNDETIIEFSIQVFNTIGKLVYSKQHALPGINQVDISGQAKGIYFVTLQAGEKVVTEKVIYQ